MMKKITVFMVLFLKIALYQLMAQSDSIAHYFDDDGISTAKNVFKLNISSAISGDVSVFYERVLGDVVTIEVGVGALMPYHIPDFYELMMLEETDLKNIKGGYSLYFAPRFYYNTERFSAPFAPYSSFQFRQRNYWLEKSNISCNDIMWVSGWQFTVSKRLLLDINIGVGLRVKSYDIKNTTTMETTDITGISVFALKIGYLL